MSAPHEAVARRLAARFAPELGERLPALTARAIADEIGEETPFRSAEPGVLIAYASFVVSLASLVWNVYRDLTRQRSVENDVAVLKGMMLERVRAEVEAPRALAAPVRERLIEAAVQETLDEAAPGER
jgi:hypothetical protein